MWRLSRVPRNLDEALGAQLFEDALGLVGDDEHFLDGRVRAAEKLESGFGDVLKADSGRARAGARVDAPRGDALDAGERSDALENWQEALDDRVFPLHFLLAVTVLGHTNP